MLQMFRPERVSKIFRKRGSYAVGDSLPTVFLEQPLAQPGMVLIALFAPASTPGPSIAPAPPPPVASALTIPNPCLLHDLQVKFGSIQ